MRPRSLPEGSASDGTTVAVRRALRPGTTAPPIRMARPNRVRAARARRRPRIVARQALLRRRATTTTARSPRRRPRRRDRKQRCSRDRAAAAAAMMAAAAARRRPRRRRRSRRRWSVACSRSSTWALYFASPRSARGEAPRNTRSLIGARRGARDPREREGEWRLNTNDESGEPLGDGPRAPRGETAGSGRRLRPPSRHYLASAPPHSLSTDVAQREARGRGAGERRAALAAAARGTVANHDSCCGRRTPVCSSRGGRFESSFTVLADPPPDSAHPVNTLRIDRRVAGWTALSPLASVENIYHSGCSKCAAAAAATPLSTVSIATPTPPPRARARAPTPPPRAPTPLPRARAPTPPP